MWAIVRTASWDSPIARATEPDEWVWYGPMSSVLIETRDLLRVMATKQYPHPKVRREQIPKLTRAPWQVDENETRFAPDPVTKDEIDAHLLRLNGRAPGGLTAAPAAKAKRRRLRADDVRQVRKMLAEGMPAARVAGFFGVSRRVVQDIAARRTWRAVD